MSSASQQPGSTKEGKVDLKSPSNKCMLVLIAFCRTRDDTKWLIMQRRPKLVSRKVSSTAATERITGPQKDQLQLFRQEFDGVNSSACIAELVSRFYPRSLPSAILDKCHFVKALSNDARRLFVMPFVIPAETLSFTGHIYEPVPIRDIDVLSEYGEIHESSAGLLKKTDLGTLYSLAHKMTPPHF